mgnify:CR=1 FL=1
MKKISILLPYKENFSPTYPGAVSLFVNSTSQISKYKKDIIVYGFTELKKKFKKLKLKNLNLKKLILNSKLDNYFIKIHLKKTFYKLSKVEILLI